MPTAATAVTIAGDTDFNCPAGSPLAYATLTVGDCKLKGDCDWRGLGEFTFKGKVDLDGHTLHVPRLDGTGLITSQFATDTSAATVPALVADSACFWLDAADASTFTYKDNGEIATWTSKDANHVVATAEGAAMGPTDGTDFWGRPTVDFGDFSSTCDLRYPRFTNLRTVFWVIKIVNHGSCHLLGDVFNGSGAYNFHRGNNSAIGNPSYAKYDEVWNGTEFIDWKSTAINDSKFQIISATMSQDCCSDSISNDRNISGRTGGRQLSELICFDTVLSAEDRTNVVKYLERKWFGGTKAPGTLVLDVPADETVATALDLAGNVKLVKEGEGAYFAGKKQYYYGDTELVRGTTVAGDEGINAIFGALYSGTFTVGPDAVYDVNGHAGMYRFPIVFNGGTVVNGGNVFDGTGPFIDVKLTADSYFDYTKGGLGFHHSFVDLGGHTLDVTTDNTTNGFFAYQNAPATDYPIQIFTNGAVRVHGGGEMKIWNDMDAHTVDFDLDCPLWMAWTTKVRNLTFRYGRSSPWNDTRDGGEFQVGGVFNPVSDCFPRTKMLDGSTLDLSAKTGTWSAVSTYQNYAGAAFECTFAPDGTVTVDVHGRTLAGGERVIAWTTRPTSVTFQWDAATAAANPGVEPFLADDGLYFGFDAATVARAVWTGAAGDGDLANPANWSCSNPAGDPVANALPNAGTTVRLEGASALDIPVGATLACAGIEVGDLKLTRDCDWRGFTGRIHIDGTIDLDGHQLKLATMPEGYPGQIASGYGFDPALATPSTITSEACFWLDASDRSTLTVDPDGRVSAWRSKGTVDVTAAPTNAVCRPTWAPFDYVRPCVDFGACGSNLDLRYDRFTKLRTVFWVIKIAKGGQACFLLGDVNNGSDGAYNFHRGGGSEYGAGQWAKFATVWNGTDVIDDWSHTVIPDDDFQVISATMAVDACSDSLTQDRNLADRNGGRQLCELICFERTLANDERTAITQYLQQKWRGFNPAGELHLEVPAGQEFVNREIKLAGNLKFVKEGAGSFNAAFRGQTYCGGTEIAEGLSLSIVTADTTYSGLNAHCYGVTGNDIVVRSGATLDMKGNPDYHVWTINLDGGTLRNSGRDMNTGWGEIGDVNVIADSTMAFDALGVVWSGEKDNFFRLNGNTLTLELNAPFYPQRAVATNGTVRLVGEAMFVNTRAVNWRTADLVVEAPMNMSADLDVRNYTAAYTGEVNAGTGAVNVYGVFKPVTDKFHGCVLQDGATLDLSDRTETFSATSALFAGNATMSFAPGSTIAVDIHGRTLAEGDQLVAWTVPPVGVTFTWDAASAQSAGQVPVARSDGLYYGGEEDMTVTDAVWTGEAGDGDISKPTNWTCRNVNGRVVEGGLPGAVAVVHISGTVKIDFPIGNAFTCQQLDLGDIKLAGDCDWRGFKLPAGAKIDLDGYKLYLSDLPATGTVTCSLIGNRVTGGEPEILSRANLWFDAADAASLSLDANQKVTRWVSRDSRHNVATVPSGFNAPSYNTTLWDGRPCVDFGAYSSGMDMEFTRVGDLRTVFEVTKIQKHTYVFLLDDTASYNFHRGGGGEYGSSQWCNIAEAWNGTTAVNPTTTVIPDNAFQFIAVKMNVDSSANRFTQDRNLSGRNGGKQLSELVCFNWLLSDEERLTVTKYLQNKWLNGACHRGELHLDVPAGKTVLNNGFMLDKSVRLFKEGEGTYVANCANLTYVGGTEVMDGMILARQYGTKFVLGPWDSELLLHAGTVFDLDGQNDYAVLKIILDGGTIRNTGADLKDLASLGKIELTADSRLEPTSSLTEWWDGHYIDLGGHTLAVSIPAGKFFSISANPSNLRNGTLDIITGGWFRVYHGPLDASTVTLRVGSAIDIDDATGGTVTAKDYLACYNWNANSGTNIIKVLGTFMPAVGAYFHGCELQNGATLDLSGQTGVFSVKGAFTSGANEMTFAEDATAIQVVVGERRITGNGKIVDWTGRTPANLADIKFTIDPASRRLGRRLIVKEDGLYVESGCIIFLR